MKVVRSSPLRTGRLYPQEYPGTHFYRLSRHGTAWCPGKYSQWRGIDPRTLRVVAQCLNHYATPGPRDRTGRARNYKKTLNSISKEFMYSVRFHEDRNLPGYDTASIRNLLPTFRKGFVAPNFMVYITLEYLRKRMRGYGQTNWLHLTPNTCTDFLMEFTTVS
jgi:hypothetical protein